MTTPTSRLTGCRARAALPVRRASNKMSPIGEILKSELDFLASCERDAAAAASRVKVGRYRVRSLPFRWHNRFKKKIIKKPHLLQAISSREP